MFYAFPNDRSPFCSFRRVLSAVVGLWMIALTSAGAASPALFQSEEGLRFELPANGNLRIENLRGGVIAEVWKENYVSVVAITDSGRQSRSPAVIRRTEGLLSIHVARGTAGAQRIDRKSVV